MKLSKGYEIIATLISGLHACQMAKEIGDFKYMPLFTHHDVKKKIYDADPGVIAEKKHKVEGDSL